MVQANWKLALLLLCAASFFENNDAATKDWWETASFYQIYPRSFMDSDNDGIGDLNGITSKLQYIKDIGITAVWLSPIFESPMIDFGYDISNFRAIQKEYGTMEDFERLMHEAEKLKLKIFLDFVPNHTSDQHEWFKKSMNREKGYEDYYIWHPGYVINGKRVPPSNWLSVFRGSAWTWNETRQEYYLHQFVYQQPDLNFRCAAVVKELIAVLLFWLGKRVHGFRMDALPHIYEVNAEKDKKHPGVDRYPDEPRNPDVIDKDHFDYLKHTKTRDQPETIQLVYQWRELLDNYKTKHGGETRAIMTEACDVSVDILKQYFGDSKSNRKGAQIPFNFQLIEHINAESTAHDYVACINNFLRVVPEGHPPNWVMGNHDRNRVGTRLGAERIDLINIMLLTLPGISITYNGDEFGMVDQWLSWEDTVDPAARNGNPKIYEKASRDPARTPLQWDDSVNAGFSLVGVKKPGKTWLPVAKNFKTLNVKAQLAAEKSHLKVYKDLQALRRTPTLMNGKATYEALSKSGQVLAIVRELHGEPTYISLLNLGSAKETVNLSKIKPDLPKELECLIVSEKSNRNKKDKVAAAEIVLGPKEGLVLLAPKKK